MNFSDRKHLVTMGLEIVGILCVIGVLLFLLSKVRDQSGQTAIEAQTPDPWAALQTKAAATSTALTRLSALAGTATAAKNGGGSGADIKTYVVQPDDILSGIAEKLDIPVEKLLQANPQLSSNPDLLRPGQKLNIPGSEVAVTAGGTPVSIPDLQPYLARPSYIVYNRDVVSNSYPLTLSLLEGKLLLHYQPGAYVETHLDHIRDLFTRAYQLTGDKMGGSLGQPIDVFAAGSLFYANENLLGFTPPGGFRTFLMIDGTGSDGEQAYIFAHELTHLFAAHKFGNPASVILKEGLATYLPYSLLTGTGGYLPLEEICAAVKAAGKLPDMTSLEKTQLSATDYAGLNPNFTRNNAAACFVKYLVDTYGWEKLGKVYSTGDYQGVYGASLADLQTKWLALLESVQFQMDPEWFTAAVDQLAGLYQAYFTRCSSGKHADWQAYLLLDRARLAVLGGKQEEAGRALDAALSLLQ